MKDFGWFNRTKEGKEELIAMIGILISGAIILVLASVFTAVFLVNPEQRQIKERDSLLIENYKLRNEILKKQLDK